MAKKRIHPLQAYREQHSLSRPAMAKILDVAPSTVWRWEKRKRDIKQNELMKVSGATGISPADLRPDLARLMRVAAE